MIRSENKGKIGILYIGSGNPLCLRLSDYYPNWYLLSRDNFAIVRALSKYGMVRFYLVILYYTDSKSILSCEQKWVDLVKPEYNINPIAGSTKRYKHRKQRKNTYAKGYDYFSWINVGNWAK